MTAFLSATRDERVTSLQRRIIDLMRDEPTTEAREALADALSARRRTFDAASLQVSVAIQRALQACADDSAKGAARAWRWSMAGVWSWLLHSDREAS
jgi:hypothetical protein